MSDKIITISEPQLLPEEALYVKYYLSTLNHHSSFLLLTPTSKGKHYSNKYSKRSNIKFHIAKQLQIRLESKELDADKVLSLLYEEATDHSSNSSHGARITALTTLGKHLGLFQDKKEESKSITYNIINYNDPTVPDDKPELEELPALEEPVELENIEITDFKEKVDGS